VLILVGIVFYFNCFSENFTLENDTSETTIKFKKFMKDFNREYKTTEEFKTKYFDHPKINIFEGIF
jgi:hypothetical protein